mmetsp:Transcript_6351/g.19066  ORF Transcript_6351/g.19066 Transcript_6351/m.19066 type:complete len:231 (+) Transcript_6351:680-1372(+)
MACSSRSSAARVAGLSAPSCQYTSSALLSSLGFLAKERNSDAQPSRSAVTRCAGRSGASLPAACVKSRTISPSSARTSSSDTLPVTSASTRASVRYSPAAKARTSAGVSASSKAGTCSTSWVACLRQYSRRYDACPSGRMLALRYARDSSSRITSKRSSLTSASAVLASTVFRRPSRRWLKPDTLISTRSPERRTCASRSAIEAMYVVSFKPSASSFPKSSVSTRLRCSK